MTTSTTNASSDALSAPVSDHEIDHFLLSYITSTALIVRVRKNTSNNSNILSTFSRRNVDSACYLFWGNTSTTAAEISDKMLPCTEEGVGVGGMGGR